MSKWKLHPSGEITPLRVSEKIGDLIREGYPQKQAVKIAHAEARRDWSAKHKGVKLPTWLKFSPNPVSEETAHKVRKATPDVFKRLTDEEIKEGLDMLKSKKRRKNPVGDYSRREYVNRKSQITKKSPSKRLRKRRGSNFDKPSKGRFPNPAQGYYVIHGQYGKNSGLYTGRLTVTDTFSDALKMISRGEANTLAGKLRVTHPNWKWTVQPISMFSK